MASDLMRRERKGEKQFWIYGVVYFWSTEERQPWSLDMGIRKEKLATCLATTVEPAHKVLKVTKTIDPRRIRRFYTTWRHFTASSMTICPIPHCASAEEPLTSQPSQLVTGVAQCNTVAPSTVSSYVVQKSSWSLATT
jgi:hypothetical protein